MNKKILFVLFLFFISIVFYCNENELNKKNLTKNDIRKIWSKIEIAWTTKKEILEMLNDYKINSINLLNNKKTGQLVFSFEYKNNAYNINSIGFLFPGTFIG